MARMSEELMVNWTREEAIAHAKDAWKVYMEEQGVSMDIAEFADKTIATIDEDGWDEDIHGNIDLAMEAWARDTWECTPWE